MQASRFYGNADVRACFGLTEKQARHLVETGGVQPMMPVNGSGSHREYDLRGMIEFAMAVELRKLGTSHQVVSACLNDMRRRWPAWHFATDSCVGFEVIGADLRVFFLESMADARRRFEEWSVSPGTPTSPVFVNIGLLRSVIKERLGAW